MKKNKVIVQLTGGLGNQMFMYATAKAISTKLGYDLIIDDKSKFITDVIYKRTCELNNFLLDYTPINSIDSYNFIGGNIIQKICRRIGLHLLNPKFKYIKEKNHERNDYLLKRNFQNNIFLEGYWQDEIYFKDIRDILKKDFCLKPELINDIRQDLNLIQKIEIPICIGIRRYQEVPSEIKIYPTEDFDFYNTAIKYFIKKYPKAEFIIFSQDMNWTETNIINKLPNLKFHFIKYSPKRTAAHDLFLMTHCKHYIISNSTFYWWGAWLSEYTDKEVICSNKFPNKYTCLESWKMK